MTIRDEYDRKAHDVICMLRYGSPGGTIRTEEVQKIGDYLRGKPFGRIIPVVAMPKVEVKKPCKPIVVLPLSK